MTTSSTTQAVTLTVKNFNPRVSNQRMHYVISDSHGQKLEIERTGIFSSVVTLACKGQAELTHQSDVFDFLHTLKTGATVADQALKASLNQAGLSNNEINRMKDLLKSEKIGGLKGLFLRSAQAGQDRTQTFPVAHSPLDAVCADPAIQRMMQPNPKQASR